jgi:hypothetical protein
MQMREIRKRFTYALVFTLYVLDSGLRLDFKDIKGTAVELNPLDEFVALLYELVHLSAVKRTCPTSTNAKKKTRFFAFCSCVKRKNFVPIRLVGPLILLGLWGRKKRQKHGTNAFFNHDSRYGES